VRIDDDPLDDAKSVAQHHIGGFASHTGQRDEILHAAIFLEQLSRDPIHEDVSTLCRKYRGHQHFKWGGEGERSPRIRVQAPQLTRMAVTCSGDPGDGPAYVGGVTSFIAFSRAFFRLL